MGVFMHLPADKIIRTKIEEIYRSDGRKVFASLVRMVNYFDLAEVRELE